MNEVDIYIYIYIYIYIILYGLFVLISLYIHCREFNLFYDFLELMRFNLIFHVCSLSFLLDLCFILLVF